MMTDQEILNLIKEALCTVAPDNKERFEQLTLDSDVKSLSIDSILTLEMVGEIEDRLARTFEEQELAKVNKLSDIAKLIRYGRIGSL